MAQLRAVLDGAAVHEAEAYLLESKKKPTYSNISIITGIQRRQVAKLLSADIEEVPPVAVSALHRAVRVLNGWYEDPVWMTRLGTPAALDVRGSGKTFESLAHKYAGGVSSAAILERLIETNTVRVIARDKDGRPSRVRPLQATLAGDVNEARLFDEFGVVYGDAMEMFDANLRSPSPTERMRPYTVTATVLEPSLRAIRRQMKERGEFVQSAVDESLARHDLATEDVVEYARRAADSLYSVRVTLFCTIKQKSPPLRTIESAWRRRAEDTGGPSVHRHRGTR